MAKSTKGGNINYTIYLSKSYTGAVGSEEPDGETYYIFAVDAQRTFQNLSKPKPSIGKSFYYPSTKYNVFVNLSTVKVAPNNSRTAGEEASILENFMYQNQVKRGSVGLYLFVYNESESRFDDLDWDINGNQTKYLLCSTDGWNGSPKKGKIYEYPSIKFTKAG
jgi:hypothetical protein